MYAACGHSICCSQCSDDLFHVDRRRFLASNLCPTCRAVFPAEVPSRLLQLDSARTSYCLDRDLIFRNHRRLDALSTTCAQLYCDEMMVPSLAEVFSLDQQDAADREREARRISPADWAITVELDYSLPYASGSNGLLTLAASTLKCGNMSWNTSRMEVRASIMFARRPYHRQAWMRINLGGDIR